MNHRLISNPIFFEQEIDLIHQLFDMGLPCFHVRKPWATEAECREFLEKIETQHHSKIVLHQHLELAVEMGLQGVHFKEFVREKMSPSDFSSAIGAYQKKGLTVGTSVHQKSVLETMPSALDYVMVSPIFQSISKPDYHPTENWMVEGEKYPYKLIALGGLEVHNLLQTRVKGFTDVAFLGAVWSDLSNVSENYRLLCTKMNLIALMS